MIKKYFIEKFNITDENYDTKNKRQRIKLILILMLLLSFVMIYFGFSVIVTLGVSICTDKIALFFDKNSIFYVVISFVVFPIGIMMFFLSVTCLKKFKHLKKLDN